MKLFSFAHFISFNYIFTLHSYYTTPILDSDKHRKKRYLQLSKY